MLGMPSLAKCIYALASNGFAATSTQGACLLVVMHVAVRLSSKFVKSAVERFLAILANKMLGVPRLTKGIGALASDWLIAASTTWCKCTRKTLVTIRTVVSLKERTIIERSQTLGADEMMHMPFPP
jgi:hypothetical protein